MEADPSHLGWNDNPLRGFLQSHAANQVTCRYCDGSEGISDIRLHSYNVTIQ